MAQAVSDPEREIFDYPDPVRPKRGVLRFLAPVALIAFAVTVLLTVKHYRHDHHSAAAKTAALVIPKVGPGRPKHGYWKVGKGQTLTFIAKREETTVATLLALNPGLKPNAVHTGQRVRVR
ncbi:MAG TPA: LysM domain-containing protein [Solirubrobacteraceae bacterium]|jgi:LysM repeat protein|nr:LysM domain-containing protein [Solirubrobacteraceae bacterium]